MKMVVQLQTSTNLLPESLIKQFNKEFESGNSQFKLLSLDICKDNNSIDLFFQSVEYEIRFTYQFKDKEPKKSHCTCNINRNDKFRDKKARFYNAVRDAIFEEQRNI